MRQLLFDTFNCNDILRSCVFDIDKYNEGKFNRMLVNLCYTLINNRFAVIAERIISLVLFRPFSLGCFLSQIPASTESFFFFFHDVSADDNFSKYRRRIFSL